MKKNLTVIAVSLLAGLLYAESISQTNTFSGVPNYSNALTFAKFDTMGGTLALTSIEVSVRLVTEAQGGIGVDNDGASPASGTVTMGNVLNIAMRTGGPRLFNDDVEGLPTLSATTSKSMTLTGDDGDTTTYSTSGSDYGFMNISMTEQTASLIIGSAYWSRYVGSGNYSFDALVSQYTDYSSFGGSQVQINPMAAHGDMVVTYNYIPEPASASLATLVIVAAAWIRRRFAE